MRLNGVNPQIQLVKQETHTDLEGACPWESNGVFAPALLQCGLWKENKALAKRNVQVYKLGTSRVLSKPFPFANNVKEP